MTSEDKIKIKEFRLKGIGYKNIATLLGLSRDSVRSFCKRNGIAGNSSVVALNLKERTDKNLLCAYCGKPIRQKSTGRMRRFCCDDCRRKWWKEHEEAKKKSKEHTYHYICPYCEKEFSAYGNKNRKYCSHNCYIKDRFWREEDGV